MDVDLNDMSQDQLDIRIWEYLNRISALTQEISLVISGKRSRLSMNEIEDEYASLRSSIIDDSICLNKNVNKDLKDFIYSGISKNLLEASKSFLMPFDKRLAIDEMQISLAKVNLELTEHRFYCKLID